MRTAATPETLAYAAARSRAIDDFLCHRQPEECETYCVHMHTGRYSPHAGIVVNAAANRDYDLTLLRKAFGETNDPAEKMRIISEFRALAESPL